MDTGHTDRLGPGRRRDTLTVWALEGSEPSGCCEHGLAARR